MKKCKFCNEELKDTYVENKIGTFCSEEHYEEFLKSLTDEEYIRVQNSFCVCSDE